MMTTPTEGFLLARAIARRPHEAHPVLMLTSVNAEHERRALRSGSRTTTGPAVAAGRRFVDKR